MIEMLRVQRPPASIVEKLGAYRRYISLKRFCLLGNASGWRLQFVFGSRQEPCIQDAVLGQSQLGHVDNSPSLLYWEEFWIRSVLAFRTCILIRFMVTRTDSNLHCSLLLLYIASFLLLLLLLLLL